jgi:hypothetical protein
MAADTVPDGVVQEDLAEEIATALRREFPSLLAVTHLASHQIAQVAAKTVRAYLASLFEPAGRCIRLVRPHRWTRWQVVRLPPKALAGPPREAQRRICRRCGLIERAGLDE